MNQIPVLPLRDVVVFPKMVIPLFVGREASINALQEVMKRSQWDIIRREKLMLLKLLCW